MAFATFKLPRACAHVRACDGAWVGEARGVWQADLELIRSKLRWLLDRSSLPALWNRRVVRHIDVHVFFFIATVALWALPVTGNAERDEIRAHNETLDEQEKTCEQANNGIIDWEGLSDCRRNRVFGREPQASPRNAPQQGEIRWAWNTPFSPRI